MRGARWCTMRETGTESGGPRTAPTGSCGDPQSLVLLWFRHNDTWVLYPWLPQLWWTRLLVVCHSLTIGTRAEAFGHARITAHVLLWWLQSWVPFFFHSQRRNPCSQHTTISQRVAFFHDPCLRTVAKQMDTENGQWRTRVG